MKINIDKNILYYKNKKIIKIITKEGDSPV